MAPRDGGGPTLREDGRSLGVFASRSGRATNSAIRGRDSREGLNSAKLAEHAQESGRYGDRVSMAIDFD